MRRRIRILPDIPGVVRFLRQVFRETPLVPMVVVLIGLWLFLSWGIYTFERGVNEQFHSYGYTLWWSFTAMQTQGANSPGPVTVLGIITGAIWSILSTIAFFGVIIATLYAYFMLPRHRPSRQIVSTIQTNLGEIEHLSINDLKTLRDTTVRVINAQIDELRSKPANHSEKQA